MYKQEQIDESFKDSRLGDCNVTEDDIGLYYKINKAYNVVYSQQPSAVHSDYYADQRHNELYRVCDILF